MPPALAAYLIAVISGISSITLQFLHGGGTPTPAPTSDVVLSAADKPWWVILLSGIASVVVPLLAVRKAHKAPPPPELVPTPDIDDPNPATAEAGKAAGEAAAAASKATGPKR